MKRKTLFLVAALAVFTAISQTGAEAVAPSFAERFTATQSGDTGVYDFDKAHSFIGFKVKHNGLIEVPGFFRDFTGTVKYDAADMTKSTVEFTAKATSVDTGVVGRDNHLRRADFFEVEKYPDLTFKSTKVEKKGSVWMLTGDLTMRGVTKSVNFPFQVAGWLAANERRGAVMGLTAETTVNRRDYNVSYGTPATLSDDIKIVLQIEAPKRRPAQPTPPAATPKP
ncbi:MAG: YceI family protein [Pyrinomonadaceae bacterium]